MQSSYVLCLLAEEDEVLAAAGSGAVYQRYLKKFICVITTVYGGYFKSLSRVIQIEFIGKDRNSSSLTSGRPRGRARRRSVSQQKGGGWTVVQREATLKTALACPEQPPGIAFGQRPF